MLREGPGTIVAETPWGAKAHVEVALWRRRDGKICRRRSVRRQVATLRGRRAAERIWKED